MTDDSLNWQEYDGTAHYLAIRGRKGDIGDALPELMTPEVVAEIASDPEAFQQRVRECAYAIAMERIAPKLEMEMAIPEP